MLVNTSRGALVDTTIANLIAHERGVGHLHRITAASVR